MCVHGFLMLLLCARCRTPDGHGILPLLLQTSDTGGLSPGPCLGQGQGLALGRGADRGYSVTWLVCIFNSVLIIVCTN